MSLARMSLEFLLARKREGFFRNCDGFSNVVPERLRFRARRDAYHAQMLFLYTLSVFLCNMLAQTALGLVSLCASFIRLWIHEGARKRLRFQMGCLDMRVESLLLPKCLVARCITSAVELGVVDVLMPLEPTDRRKSLAASLPITRKVAFRFGVQILEVSLNVVFARKSLVAIINGAGEGSFVVVAPKVGFEAAGTVEALAAARMFAHVVPLSTRLALGSLLPVVGEVHNVVVRVVGHGGLLRDQGLFR